MSRSVLFLSAFLAITSIGISPTNAVAAEEPASSGRPEPAADKLAPMSLSNGIIQFPPPPEPFVFSAVADGGKGAMFREPGGAAMLVMAVGGKAPKSAEWARFMSEEIIQRLVINLRNKPDVKPIEVAAAVKDDRFDLVVHESWEKDGRKRGQWHFYQYRTLRPHMVVVTFAMPMEDEAQVQRLREMAEQVALSAALVPRGTKAPPGPDAKNAVRIEHEGADDENEGEDMPAKPAPGDQAEVAAAQKKLDDAIAAADAQLEQTPLYARLKRTADDLHQRLIALRAADPPDRPAIASASLAWIEAKARVESLRKEAQAKDPAVAEAKKELEEAKARR